MNYADVKLALYVKIQKEQKELCIKKLCIFLEVANNISLLFDLVRLFFIDLKILIYHSFIEAGALDQTEELYEPLLDFPEPHTLIRYGLLCHIVLSPRDNMSIIYSHYMKNMEMIFLCEMRHYTDTICDHDIKLEGSKGNFHYGWEQHMTTYHTHIHINRYIPPGNHPNYTIIEKIITRLKIKSPVKYLIKEIIEI